MCSIDDKEPFLGALDEDYDPLMEEEDPDLAEDELLEEELYDEEGLDGPLSDYEDEDGYEHDYDEA